MAGSSQNYYMKKQNSKNTTVQRKNYLEWKKRRDIRLTSIPVEVDLENREIFFKDDLNKKLKLEFSTNNVDRLISNYVDPKDSEKVIQSLQQAQQGQEKPILFNFIHPHTAQKLKMEYRYEIVYVKYASTRLDGVLVNVRDRRSRKNH